MKEVFGICLIVGAGIAMIAFLIISIIDQKKNNVKFYWRLDSEHKYHINPKNVTYVKAGKDEMVYHFLNGEKLRISIAGNSKDAIEDQADDRNLPFLKE